jgi:hypothetical protein
MYQLQGSFENSNKDKSENGELTFAYFKELGLAHRLETIW